MAATPNFKQRLRAGELLVGTYIKTPAPAVCEVLGMSELDAICLDAEHAPFGRAELDHCIHALRAAGKPSLVRVAANAPEYILQALDCGATGIIVPHVASPEEAAAVAAAAHFGQHSGTAGRGYAGSTRAGGFGTVPMQKHLRNSADTVTTMIQIEDPAAVDAVKEIAAVPGIDCLFVGRIDLTVAYGAETPNDEKVLTAVRRVCAAGRNANIPVGMFVPDPAEVPQWIEAGAAFFLLASDQAFILRGANELARGIKTG